MAEEPETPEVKEKDLSTATTSSSYSNLSSSASNTIKKKVEIELDLDVDTSVSDSSKNPYAKIIHLARAIDAWRIFPRIFFSVYIYLLYKTVIWFIGLETPTMEQAGLISVITGVGAAWFGLYVHSGGGKTDE
jgi:hypothetical protein